MKQFIFALLIGLFALPAFAQGDLRLSFSGGPSINWLAADDKNVDRGSASIGFDFGLTADYYFTFEQKYAFSTGLYIVSSGGQLRYLPGDTFRFAGQNLANNTKVTFSLRYLEVPTVLKLKTSQFHRTNYWGQFGLSSFINIGAKGNSSDGKLDRDKINDEVRLFNLALNVGAGIEYDLGSRNALSVGVILKNGFFDVTSNKQIDDSTFLHSLQLKVGLIF